MRDLIVLVVIGLGTYLMRAAFLVVSRPEPPARLARLLPHVGPAVLAAITAPALLAPHGTPAGMMALADTLTGALAAAVAWVLWWRTRNLPVALFGGLALSWLTMWVLP